MFQRRLLGEVEPGALVHRLIELVVSVLDADALDELLDDVEPRDRLKHHHGLRSTQLTTELPLLLAALSSRLGPFDRVVYDENVWAPAPLHLGFRGSDVILDSSPDQSINTISLIREHAGRLVLLVVPSYISPTRAYTAVMTAAKPDDASTTDELLGIGKQAAEDRRFALMAHQRWESDGGALRRRRHQPGGSAATGRSGGAECSVITNSKPCATSSAGFDGTAQNWLGSSAPWSLASEESPQACTGKNARGGGGVES